MLIPSNCFDTQNSNYFSSNEITTSPFSCLPWELLAKIFENISLRDSLHLQQTTTLDNIQCAFKFNLNQRAKKYGYEDHLNCEDIDFFKKLFNEANRINQIFQIYDANNKLPENNLKHVLSLPCEEIIHFYSLEEIRRSDNLEIFSRYLLKNFTSVSKKNLNDQAINGLVLSLSHLQPITFKFLVQLEIINSSQPWFNSALDVSILLPCSTSLQRLLEQPNSMHLLRQSNITPLHLIAAHADVVNIIIEYLMREESEYQNIFQNSELLSEKASSENPYLQVIRDLIETGLDIDHFNKSELSPLHIASRNGRLEVVDALIQCGANIHLQIKIGKTPIQLAMYMGHLKVVTRLMQAGANIKKR